MFLRQRCVNDHERLPSSLSQGIVTKQRTSFRTSCRPSMLGIAAGTVLAGTAMFTLLLPTQSQSYAGDPRDDNHGRMAFAVKPDASFDAVTHAPTALAEATLSEKTTASNKSKPGAITHFLNDPAVMNQVLQTFRKSLTESRPVPVEITAGTNTEDPPQRSTASTPGMKETITTTLEKNGDVYGALTLEGASTLAQIIGINRNDSIVALGDGQSLLTIALNSAPAKALSITDVPRRHAVFVDVLERFTGNRHEWQMDEKMPNTPITARWLAPEKLLMQDSVTGSTVVLLISQKWTDAVVFQLVRSWVNALPPGSAVVTLQRWPHCHAGLVGPLVQTRLPFVRLPKGGQVFVYLVAPRLTFGSLPNQAVTKTQTNLSAIHEIFGFSSADANVIPKQDVQKYLEGHLADTQQVLLDRLEKLLGVDGGFAVPEFRGWLFGRVTGNASSPLECLFRDLFVRATGMQHPSKLSDSEIAELGGKRTSYSEIDPVSWGQLLLETILEEGDVLLDLGFGLGKTLFQAALAMPIHARGIELSPTRHRRAADVWDLLKDGEAQHLGGLDTQPLQAPLGTADLILGNYLLADDSLWHDASVVLHNILVESPSQHELFALSLIAQQKLIPGTTLVTVIELPGCHRGLKFIQKVMVRVDWSNVPIAAFLYMVSPHPPLAVPFQQISSPLLLNNTQVRQFQCLSVNSMAADVDGRIEAQVVEARSDSAALPARIRRISSHSHVNMTHLLLGWLRGDELSTWDCFFKDVWYLLTLNSSSSGKSALSKSWSDSTSVNKDNRLDKLNWAGLGGPRTYGEARPGSIATLLRMLHLDSNDIFYDLGSGLGKVILQAHLQTPVRRAVGIELETSRHEVAGNALAQIRHLGVIDSAREVIFILGDITNASLWSDATLIFMLCTCFPEEVLAAVTSAVAALPLGTRLVAASFQINLPTGLHHELQLKNRIVLPTTFSDGEPFYIYEVVEAVAKQHTIHYI